MKDFIRLVILLCVLAFFGGLLTGKSAFAEDCKYKQIIKLDDNGEVLSSKTEYICKGSKPILVLEPTVTDQVKYKRPPVVSTYDYMQSVNSNENRLDRILSLLYSGS
tara:strand:+ start:1059 stop:1379 length:321 start_codon:yes stop_codon:yes gene_type:complete